MEGDKSTSPGSRSESKQDRIRLRILPRFGALRGDNTPSPALRGLRMMTKINRVATRWLLELFGKRRMKGKARSPPLSIRVGMILWVLLCMAEPEGFI